MINKETCKVLREKMDEALKSVGTDMGLVIKTGNMSFTSNEINIKVNALSITEDGSTYNKEEMNYRKYEDLLGLPPLGTVITLHGKNYRISGFNEKGRTNRILIKDEKGAEYGISVEQARNCTGSNGVSNGR